jgi:hypothetical protein
LKDHYNASAKQLDLVPELKGSEDTLRERYDISVSDQPTLYIPTAVTPETYYIRNAKFNLLNVNDMILAKDIYPHILDNITLSANVTGKTSKKTATISPNLLSPVMVPNPTYLFEGLTYDQYLIGDYVGSLFTEKVSDWDANGLKVESCEEYAYEKFYDFSLFKDYNSFHGNNDPLMVVEYAYRNSVFGPNLIQSGDYATTINSIKDDRLVPGSIGSKLVNVNDNQLYRKLGTGNNYTQYDYSMDEVSREMTLYYNVVLFQNTISSDSISYFYGNNSSDINWDVNNVLTKYPRDLMAKNFFVEVMGHINKDNKARTSGIVLSNPDLISVFSAEGFASAQAVYDNDFKFHFVMM